MPGHRPVADLGWALTDRERLPVGTLGPPDPGTRLAARPHRGQLPVQVLPQRAPRLHVKRLIDGLVRHPTHDHPRAVVLEDPRSTAETTRRPSTPRSAGTGP